jgi:hypothetical protein
MNPEVKMAIFVGGAWDGLSKRVTDYPLTMEVQRPIKFVTQHFFIGTTTEHKVEIDTYTLPNRPIVVEGIGRAIYVLKEITP